MMLTFCADTFATLLADSIYPLALLSAVIFSMIIGITYAISQAVSNPKLSLWAKTEIVQLIISVVFVFILLNLMGSFCTFTSADIAPFTNVVNQPAVLSIYNASETYLKNAVYYARVSMTASRFYLGAINLQEGYSTWKCPGFCFLSVGGGGVSTSPEAGASYLTSGFTFLLNSSLMSYLSAFMHMFFLNYIGSGLFLFLMPIAIISRSLPYMRTFGSVILAVIFSFYIIYPLILSAFYVGFSGSMQPGNINMWNEDKLIQQGSGGGAIIGSYGLSEKTSAGDINTAASLAAPAFFYAVFLPTLALLTAAASAMYLAKLMGEEIDLSRLTQMV